MQKYIKARAYGRWTVKDWVGSVYVFNIWLDCRKVDSLSKALTLAENLTYKNKFLEKGIPEYLYDINDPDNYEHYRPQSFEIKHINLDDQDNRILFVGNPDKETYFNWVRHEFNEHDNEVFSKN